MDDFVWKYFFLVAGVAAGCASIVGLLVSFLWRRAAIAMLLTAIIVMDNYWWHQATGGGDASQWQLKLVDLLYIIAFLTSVAFLWVKEAKMRLFGSMIAFAICLALGCTYWTAVSHFDPDLVREVAEKWVIDPDDIVQNQQRCLAGWSLSLFGLTALMFWKRRCQLLFPNAPDCETADLQPGAAWILYWIYLLAYFILVIVFGNEVFGV